ncbi:uncharacterized protein K460DRAFT_103855 [Cucurbitaria berberidis CBS 394.84]|uniref:Uncharacterized protein n=1 Tax=Cucurbitaria berberidis CBS 394.84 TaxID=1168544 RepID=A0A9P4GH61_9PLEO|nr:uncharacterized protein K460DRAFT_103855 [Cucurbitaria berberidis CBS 394.84]KAF1845141.1 hypothetical protein K460DRAFT_103855 [Cucurbitaria berberidis CBS 394.84]
MVVSSFLPCPLPIVLISRGSCSHPPVRCCNSQPYLYTACFAKLSSSAASKQPLCFTGFCLVHDWLAPLSHHAAVTAQPAIRACPAHYIRWQTCCWPWGGGGKALTDWAAVQRIQKTTTGDADGRKRASADSILGRPFQSRVAYYCW